MEIDAIRALIQNELNAVNDLITEHLSSDVVLINQLSHYIINSGGKRLRPVLVLLAANACGYQGTHHRTLAAVIEFIHTATLLHDDVVDESDMRRGRETANTLFGNEASILVGDFLYSRAFQMMVEIRDMDIMRIMADTTNTIASGEVLQLLNAHDAETTEQRYFDVIARKTAKLFEASAQMGAILSFNEALVEPLAAYGAELGITFQLVDDVLDYSSDADTIGKNIGDDLAEGKPTLPIIRAISQADETNAALLKSAIAEGSDRGNISTIVEVINSTDAIEYTMNRARAHAKAAQKAIDILPESPYKQALAGLADYAVARTH